MTSAIDFLPTISSCQAVSQINRATARWGPHAGNDQPRHGRLFFEQVIRENLDLGRPQQVTLIFNRKITRNTPGLFRTHVVTQDDPILECLLQEHAD